MRYKKLFYVFLGIGLCLGCFFGVSPGVLIDTNLLTTEVSRDVASNRFFFLFMTFLGYLAMVLLIVTVILTVVGRSIRKNRSEKRIRKVVFDNGKGTIDRTRLRKMSGLVEEELLRLFPVSRDSFTFEEFEQARKLAKSKGISPRDDASDLFRINKSCDKD